MQAVEQPKKSKLWALLSGILGIVWGGLIFVAPSYILPNIFSIVIFAIAAKVNRNGDSTEKPPPINPTKALIIAHFLLFIFSSPFSL